MCIHTTIAAPESRQQSLLSWQELSEKGCHSIVVSFEEEAAVELLLIDRS